MRVIITLLVLLFTQASIAQPVVAADTNDLHNRELIIGVKPTPPFVIKNDSNVYNGVSIDLWEQIAGELELEYRLVEMELPELIQSLESGSIDASINPLTVTSKRVSVFHFTQPFYISSLSVATRVDEQNAIWAFVMNFFSPAFLNAVLLLFLVILVFGFLAWLFERKANPDEFANDWKGVWDGIWWSAVTMTTVGYGDKSPKSAGGRIVALIWMFTAIVIISGFTASIASSLTIDQLGAEINDVADLKKHRVATIDGSTSERFLSDKEIEFDKFKDPEEALAALKSGKVQAVVYDTPVLQYLSGLEDWRDHVTVLPFQFNTQYYAFSLARHNDALIDRINPVLLNIIEDVRYKALMNEYHLLD